MKHRWLALAFLALAGPVAGHPGHPRWPPQDYALCYGSWTPDMVRRALDFDLVVVHPGANLDNVTPEVVDQIKRGKDGQPGTSDDVTVLAYVSIGEDDRPPAGPPPAQKQLGPTYYLNKSWHQAHNGYPTRFLDQVAYVFEKNGERRYGENGKPITVPGQDGIPDENGVWGSYYVNAGDPEWQKEVLGRMATLSRQLAVDGFFLDTLDTASPWGNYSYSQPQMASLLTAIRRSQPDSLIVANRGMFLIESQPQAFAANIDGLLYESLYCIWDWGARRGVVSPWAVGDYAYLQHPVLPASRKNPGFHLFYVNYLDPKQDDFYPLMHAIEDLVGRQGISNYVADPLLQGLAQPLSQLFPEQGEAAPELGNLSLKELSLGRFLLSYEVTRTEGRELGKDLFLDVRLARESKLPTEIPLLEPVRVDYTTPATVTGVGLEKGTAYVVYARVVGKSRNCRTSYLHVGFTTATGPQPAQITDLQVASLEGSVELTWKDSANPDHSYRVYQGPTPDKLVAVATTREKRYRLRSLPNGQPFYFSVTALDNQQHEGALCRPVLGQAEDCTPPASPTRVEFEAQGSRISLTWSACSDAKSYKVYCVARGEKYRIPIRVEAPQTHLQLGALARGDYQLWVTSVDDAGNESRRNQRVDIHLK